MRDIISFANPVRRPVIFWFDRTEPLIWLFDSTAILYLWGSPSEAEKRIATPEQRAALIAQKTLFVILTGDPKTTVAKLEVLKMWI